MNRRSFLSRLVGTIVAASLAIRLQQPEELDLTLYVQAGNRWGKTYTQLYMANMESHLNELERALLFGTQL